MKKKIIILSLVLSIAFTILGCNNNKISEKAQKEKEPAVEVVAQSVSDHNNNFWNTAFTVKNNLDEPINTISLVINELDSNGNILGTTYPQDPSIVQPGQTIVLKGMHKDNTGIASVKVIEIYYTSGEEHLTDETIESNFKQEKIKNTEPLPLQ